jgi:hypothetical protein
MRGMYMRSIGAGILGATGTAFVIGVSTAVIANPWFSRKIPVRAFDVVVLIALSLITGTLLATYVVADAPAAGVRRAGIGSGFLGWFAVSCPVCNKLVIALVGVSGATGVVEPLQPTLGALAVALGAAALAVRLRAIRRGTCQLRSLSPRPSAATERPGP